MPTLLIIDDEEKLRHLLARILRGEGFTVLEAPDGKTALKRLEQSRVDVVLCDVKLPDVDGVSFVPTLKQHAPGAEVILLTAFGNIPDGVRAMQLGAFDYLVKGDDNERILPLLNRAMERVELRRRVESLEKQVGEKYSFSRIIGSSQALKKAVDLAQKVAPTDAPVLLGGETGTGKEVFAQAIHQASRRAGKNFVALNCSAFGRDLLESELFGHRQGSFTGAHKDQKGLLEEAHGGTLFLDEIGEMPIDLQAKLLRVLESGEFVKIGDTKPTRVDFRLLAATNRDLEAEAEAGRFRADLFYRINVFQLVLPPLRERVLDIAPLAHFFAKHYAIQTNRVTPEIPDNFQHRLEQHAWPGNIRELKNVIERSVILSEGRFLALDTLPMSFHDPEHPDDAYDLAVVEKKHILKVLQHTGGNKTETARLLGIGLSTLYRKLDEYKI
ncbi:MAG: sigma-54-dependent Fis family transcriptional regulator [Saprospiraceae bacterium]|nr:sigma-54-dependent Fis family transcriptional regulator [Saprospiraceae bacterium]